MSRLHKVLVYGLCLALGVGLAIAARADNVDLLNFGNVDWDMSAYPTQSPSVTIQIQNEADSSNLIFNGYDLNLYYNRTAGSGSIELGTAANPSSNSIVPYSLDPVVNVNYVTNTAGSDINYVVPNSPTNVVTLTFQPQPLVPPTVGSVFQVWSDYTVSDYVDYTGSVVTQYANNTDSDYLLGTVTITAVPEPSAVVALLSGLGMLGVGGGFQWWRKRSRRSSTTPS